METQNSTRGRKARGGREAEKGGRGRGREGGGEGGGEREGERGRRREGGGEREGVRKRGRERRTVRRREAGGRNDETGRGTTEQPEGQEVWELSQEEPGPFSL